MIHHVCDEHGLTHVVDKRDNPIFVAANIENRCSPFGSGIARDIRLAEQGFDVLKRMPSGVPGKLEPVIEGGCVLPTFRPRFVKCV